MTIHKIKKHQDQIPYEMVSRQVAQSVENPTALAIWLYLLTKPENWVVRRTDIKTHFGIGDVSYKNAVDDLERLGLYHKQTIKTENGRFADTLINIYSLPKINPIADNPNSDEPEAGEPVFPSVRIPVSGPLKENEIPKEDEIIIYEGKSVDKSPVKQSKRFTPPVNHEVTNYMVERGLQIPASMDEAEKFCDYYETVGWVVGKSGKKMKSWKWLLL